MKITKDTQEEIEIRGTWPFRSKITFNKHVGCITIEKRFGVMGLSRDDYDSIAD